MQIFIAHCLPACLPAPVLANLQHFLQRLSLVVCLALLAIAIVIYAARVRNEFYYFLDEKFMQNLETWARRAGGRRGEAMENVSMERKKCQTLSRVCVCVSQLTGCVH